MRVSIYFVGILLRVAGVGRTVRILSYLKNNGQKPDDPVREVLLLAEKFRSVLPNRPFVYNRCLTNAVTLCWYLSSSGIESQVVIGVRKSNGLDAHAWLEYDGQPLLDGLEVVTYYKPIHTVTI